MSDYKFYKDKKFKALQSKWYKKLRETGDFEDIEFYNPKRGIGHGSPYMKSKHIPDSGVIRNSYKKTSETHYRICRNFAEHGPFIPNLINKFHNLDKYDINFGNLEAYLATFEQIYTILDHMIWTEYCAGTSLRQISRNLRSLHQLGHIGEPPKHFKQAKKRHTWGTSSKGQPYSVYWVKHRVDYLKAGMVHFNLTDSDEGINVWSEFGDLDAMEQWLEDFESNPLTLASDLQLQKELQDSSMQDSCQTDLAQNLQKQDLRQSDTAAAAASVASKLHNSNLAQNLQADAAAEVEQNLQVEKPGTDLATDRPAGTDLARGRSGKTGEAGDI